MKELDKSGLEFIKLDATKRINKIDQKEAQKYVQRASPGALLDSDYDEEIEDEIEENLSDYEGQEDFDDDNSMDEYNV